MNFLELINKCLVELNYKQVNAFSELVKNDHKKIKNILNMINTEICRFDKWNFLLRKRRIVLPKHTGELDNTINGRIDLVLIDGKEYKYCDDFEKFLTNSQKPYTYSCFNDKFLFPIFNEDKNVDIIYYTANNSMDGSGTEKQNLKNENDVSLIPDPFAEPILVYGTCMRLKANPQHVKFNYWLSMYKDAIANLRSRNCISADYSPNVKLFRF